MKLLLVGFPHTRFNDVEFSHCAFTAKAVRLVEMLRSEVGAHVTVLWGGDPDEHTAANSDEFISLLSAEEQRRLHGDNLPATILHLDWSEATAHWRMINHRSAAWLHCWAKEGDIVMTMSGSNHDGLYHEMPHLKWVEPCVGYAGISMKTKGKVFESNAWMHHLYGRYGINDGNPLDAVIPNFYRPEDFAVGDDQGYLLFVGRQIRRKGIELVVEIARRMQRPLMIAGQGGRIHEGNLVCDDATVVPLNGVQVQHVGTVRAPERKALYAGASCTLAPTLYIEPWGGVFSEAMLSGVWPVTTNWGGFTDWIPPQARFGQIEDAVEAVQWAIANRGSYTDGSPLRDFAIGAFGLKTCAQQYGQWLARIEGSD